MNDMFTILDTETTNNKPPFDFVEVAYKHYNSLKPLTAVAGFHSYYKPKLPISLGASATHHIFMEDLETCRPSSEFIFPETGYLVGHNIDFDWEVLGKPEVPRICTLAIARKLFPDLESHTLSALAYFFNGLSIRETIKNAHSAETDIELTENIFKNLLAVAETNFEVEFANIHAVYKFSEWCRVPDTMAFGKWKGTKIKEVPLDYVVWLLRQPDLDPYLEKALRDTHKLIRGTR